MGTLNNKGGGGVPWNDRPQVLRFRKLVLDWAIEKMENGTPAEKKEVALKALTTCVPRELEVGGGGENPVRVLLVKEMNGTSTKIKQGDNGGSAPPETI